MSMSDARMRTSARCHSLPAAATVIASVRLLPGRAGGAPQPQPRPLAARRARKDVSSTRARSCSKWCGSRKNSVLLVVMALMNSVSFVAVRVAGGEHVEVVAKRREAEAAQASRQPGGDERALVVAERDAGLVENALLNSRNSAAERTNCPSPGRVPRSCSAHGSWRRSGIGRRWPAAPAATRVTTGATCRAQNSSNSLPLRALRRSRRRCPSSRLGVAASAEPRRSATRLHPGRLDAPPTRLPGGSAARAGARPCRRGGTGRPAGAVRLRLLAHRLRRGRGPLRPVRRSPA